eukprot:3941007-Rhodomonas_salina.7
MLPEAILSVLRQEYNTTRSHTISRTAALGVSSRKMADRVTCPYNATRCPVLTYALVLPATRSQSDAR